MSTRIKDLVAMGDLQNADTLALDRDGTGTRKTTLGDLPSILEVDRMNRVAALSDLDAITEATLATDGGEFRLVTDRNEVWRYVPGDGAVADGILIYDPSYTDPDDRWRLIGSAGGSTRQTAQASGVVTTVASGIDNKDAFDAWFALGNNLSIGAGVHHTKPVTISNQDNVNVVGVGPFVTTIRSYNPFGDLSDAEKDMALWNFTDDADAWTNRIIIENLIFSCDALNDGSGDGQDGLWIEAASEFDIDNVGARYCRIGIRLEGGQLTDAKSANNGTIRPHITRSQLGLYVVDGSDITLMPGTLINFNGIGAFYRGLQRETRPTYGNRFIGVHFEDHDEGAGLVFDFQVSPRVISCYFNKSSLVINDHSWNAGIDDFKGRNSSFIVDDGVATVVRDYKSWRNDASDPSNALDITYPDYAYKELLRRNLIADGNMTERADVSNWTAVNVNISKENLGALFPGVEETLRVEFVSAGAYVESAGYAATAGEQLVMDVFLQAKDSSAVVSLEGSVSGQIFTYGLQSKDFGDSVGPSYPVHHITPFEAPATETLTIRVAPTNSVPIYVNLVQLFPNRINSGYSSTTGWTDNNSTTVSGAGGRTGNKLTVTQTGSSGRAHYEFETDIRAGSHFVPGGYVRGATPNNPKLSIGTNYADVGNRIELGNSQPMYDVITGARTDDGGALLKHVGGGQIIADWTWYPFGGTVMQAPESIFRRLLIGRGGGGAEVYDVADMYVYEVFLPGHLYKGALSNRPSEVGIPDGVRYFDTLNDVLYISCDGAWVQSGGGLETHPATGNASLKLKQAAGQEWRLRGQSAQAHRLEVIDQTGGNVPLWIVTAAPQGALQINAADVVVGDGAWDGVPLRLGSTYLWVDGSGNLRIHTSAPASDTDGTVVGAQT